MPVLILTTSHNDWQQFGRPTAFAGWETSEQGETNGEYVLMVGRNIMRQGGISGSTGEVDMAKHMVGKLNASWLAHHRGINGVPTLSVDAEPVNLFVEEDGVESIAQAVRDIAIQAGAGSALGRALGVY